MISTDLDPCPACGTVGADPVTGPAQFPCVVACRRCTRLRGGEGTVGSRLPTVPAAPIAFAAELVRRFALTAADLVVEIGSGTGGRLRAVRRLGPHVLGVEPHLPDVTKAFQAGVDTIGAAFGPGVADAIARRYGPARVLLVRDVRAFDGDPAAFLAAAAACLTPDGVVVAEVLVGGTAHLVELTPTPAAAAAA